MTDPSTPRYVCAMCVIIFFQLLGLLVGFSHEVFSLYDGNMYKAINMASQNNNTYETLCIDNCLCGQFQHPLLSLVDKNLVFSIYRNAQWSNAAATSMASQWFVNAIMSNKVKIPANIIFCRGMNLEVIPTIKVGSLILQMTWNESTICQRSCFFMRGNVSIRFITSKNSNNLLIFSYHCLYATKKSKMRFLSLQSSSENLTGFTEH